MEFDNSITCAILKVESLRTKGELLGAFLIGRDPAEDDISEWEKVPFSEIRSSEIRKLGKPGKHGRTLFARRVEFYVGKQRVADLLVRGYQEKGEWHWWVWRSLREWGRWSIV